MTLPSGATAARRVGGGDINEAWRLRLADGREAFVKTRPDAAPGEYEREARALVWLAQPGALRVPRPLEVSERYLVLEWIEPGRLSAAGEEELGRGLADTHMAGAPHFGDPWSAPEGGPPPEGAAPEPAQIGSLRLPNEPLGDWPAFYAERRLRPLAALALERGAITQSGAAAVERVCERLPALAGPHEPPARLHGDLWVGNVHGDSEGHPWLIDPSGLRGPSGDRPGDAAALRLSLRAHLRGLRGARAAGARLAGARRSVAAPAAAGTRGAVRGRVPAGRGGDRAALRRLSGARPLRAAAS